jgi:myo-inositol-1(or 4)-monophosphatase
VDLDAAMDVALEAVRAGCAVLAKGRRKLDRLKTTVKSPGDITTEIDRLAETAIMECIRASFPGHAFTGEEGGDWGQSPCRWIVDPLDGTVNYVHGLPYYAVSAALEEQGRIVLGVVADPARKEFFTAIRGRGAYLNGKRLAVSRRPSLDQAVVGTVVPPPRWPGLEEYLGMFRRVARQAAGMRRSGAAALDLAYVASGRLDGFFVLSLKAWDIAAGSLLVLEAGGAVADVDGPGDPLVSNRLAAANPYLLPTLLALLRQAGDQPS